MEEAYLGDGTTATLQPEKITYIKSCSQNYPERRKLINWFRGAPPPSLVRQPLRPKRLTNSQCLSWKRRSFGRLIKLIREFPAHRVISWKVIFQCDSETCMEKYFGMNCNQKLKPFVPETKPTFSLEMGSKGKLRPQNKNHGFSFGHEEGKGFFALSRAIHGPIPA